MNERRNDLEVVTQYLQIALTIPDSDRSPLYDVRNPARASCEGRDMRSDVSRTMIKTPIRRSSISSGGARRDRTDDLMLAKHALSQLSYGPVPEDECFTSIVETQCARSRWWAWEDLNFRPHAYQARALTN